MSTRTKMAREAVFDAMIEHGPDGHTDGHDKITAACLAAADAVMFDDAAVEQAAIALGIKQYPMIEGFWDDVDPDFRDKCRDQASAVIETLKGDAK